MNDNTIGGLVVCDSSLQAKMLFEAMLTYGIAMLFALQVMINIGVNTGLLPTKGLTLPFVSYGGASLIVSCFMAALLIRIQFECEQIGARGD